MDDKMPAPRTLPVSVEKQQQARPASFLHIDMQLVNLWKLLNAVIVVTMYIFFAVTAYTLITHDGSRREASWLFPPAVPKMTDAEGTLASALAIGMLWCSTPQAAAVALGLLLQCHDGRVGRAAAYTALAVTVASHCMYAGTVRTGILICGIYFLCLHRGE